MSMPSEPALCCECGMLRTVTLRGQYVAEELDTIGMRCVVRRKCQVCGVTTNHATIREDEYRNHAEESTCAPWERYRNWDLSEAAEHEARRLEEYAEILSAADRHCAWYPPRFVRTVEQVADELWPIGIRMADARDLSREDRDGRRSIGVYYWYPDEERTDVIPDTRSTAQEVVILLRVAEQMVREPERRERYEVQVNDEGRRWLGLVRFASERSHASTS